MSLLQTTTGKAVTSDGSCDLYAFVLPTEQNGLATDMFLGKVAQKLAQSMTRDPYVRLHVSPVIAPSVLHMPPEISGNFATASYNVVDGTILKIAAKRRSGYRSFMYSAMLFIRMRATAETKSIRVRPVGIPDVAFNYLEIMGAFDIISYQQAESYGARISPANKSLANNRYHSQVVEIVSIAPEVEPPVTAQTVEGSDTPMMVVQRKRIIDEI